MSNTNPSPQVLLRLEEQLRQERETFDHRKLQDVRWFALRLRMGYTAAVMLPLVALACAYVLLNHPQFPPSVVTSAGAALLVDVLGLVVAVWKVVLNPGSVTRLDPVISHAGTPQVASTVVASAASHTDA